MIGETCADGRAIAEYAYVGDRLLAMWARPSGSAVCATPVLSSDAAPVTLGPIPGSAAGPYWTDEAVRALYHFDSESVMGGQVTTPDSGASHLDGTLGGATLPTLVASPVGLGNAYSFDGVQRGSASDQRITLPASPNHRLAGQEEWALDLSVTPTVFPPTQNQEFIVLMRGANSLSSPGVLNDYQLSMMRTSNYGTPEIETVQFRFSYWGSNSSIHGTSTAINFGQTTWAALRNRTLSIRITFNRTHSVPFVVFVDGIPAATSLTPASATAVDYPMRLGSHSRLDLPRAWGGVVDELRFSDTDRSDDLVPPDVPGITETAVYYYHLDHLGTPQRMTDQAGAVVWDAVYDPFGSASIATEEVTNNLRFPGQYFDAETGLHQNWFRDYDPSIGRFLQSDPTGLGGGLSTFGYVGANPLVWTDRMGLSADNDWRDIPNVPGDLPQVPEGAANAATGFGDAFLIPELVRDATGVDGSIDKCSSAYKGGEVAGTVTGLLPFGLQGAARLSATQIRVRHAIGTQPVRTNWVRVDGTICRTGKAKRSDFKSVSAR